MEKFQDPEDVEVDTFEQILDQVAILLAESIALVEALDREGPISFDENSVTLHHASYQKDTRKILLQCVSVKGKWVTYKWHLEIEIKNGNPSDAMELHRATKEALAHTMDDQDRENVRLK